MLGNDLFLLLVRFISQVETDMMYFYCQGRLACVWTRDKKLKLRNDKAGMKRPDKKAAATL
jgi:hypothetical protein